MVRYVKMVRYPRDRGEIHPKTAHQKTWEASASSATTRGMIGHLRFLAVQWLDQLRVEAGHTSSEDITMVRHTLVYIRICQPNMAYNLDMNAS